MALLDEKPFHSVYSIVFSWQAALGMPRLNGS
jgi:hypothetical protein